MKRKGAEGADVVHRMAPAANEEFTAMVHALDKAVTPSRGLGSVRGVADPRQRILRILQRDAGARTRPVPLEARDRVPGAALAHP